MIAAFGTLAFLGTFWMLVVVGAAIFEQSGAKIATALRGEPRQPALTLVSLSVRPAARQPIRVKAQLRAAA